MANIIPKGCLSHRRLGGHNPHRDIVVSRLLPDSVAHLPEDTQHVDTGPNNGETEGSSIRKS